MTQPAPCSRTKSTKTQPKPPSPTPSVKSQVEPPQFIDNGLRFTVIFPNHALYPHGDLQWLGTIETTGLSRTQREALLHMRSTGPMTNGAYRRLAGVDSTTARTDLKDLVARGLAVQTGQRRGTHYVLAPGLASGITREPV
ncbi:hypothetical protein [Actinomyces respiraculi]|uniref:hypothetical protein n=1 Tax=Actinomyces respiraculi TaxID=2744574 RepID=UPI00142074C2|nr:hypothetical protein [Actinomyces respiraculi]